MKKNLLKNLRNGIIFVGNSINLIEESNFQVP